MCLLLFVFFVALSSKKVTPFIEEFGETAAVNQGFEFVCLQYVYKAPFGEGNTHGKSGFYCTMSHKH